ncbi:MAG: CRISPR-associated protein Csx19 [Pseudanabaena sp.]|jgi:CRISPR-associated protein (TIGR03984 family)|nr:TIGR03984 family CRISPR-associated protein [Pseudanabaena sp. M046S1SP1A06QC]
MITTIVKPNVEHCDPPDFLNNQDLRDWLEGKAQQHNLRYLLAHAEDGVIWGRFDDHRLKTSGDVFDQFAKLRSQILQQCRMFGDKCEVMLWKVGKDWKARSIEDTNNPDCLPDDEHQILWGTKPEQEKDGFTLVADGQEGLKHAVPLINISFDQSKTLYRPLRLTVRHYLDEDPDTGVVRIYLSRLVNLTGQGGQAK